MQRHGRSPSSERFLDVFSPPSSNILTGTPDHELNEYEVLWTGDFTQTISPSNPNPRFPSFRQPQNSGILAALSEDNRKLLYRKPSFSSSSRLIPAIPKPPQDKDKDKDYSQSLPLNKFQQSAPMNVPIMPRKAFYDVDDVEVDDDEEMMPPHEIVARSSTSPKTTFSVLEGVGRTLKGRDLRQVRNAVWRQTGFQD